MQSINELFLHSIANIFFSPTKTSSKSILEFLLMALLTLLNLCLNPIELFPMIPARLIIKNSSSLDFAELCWSQDGTVIKFFRKSSPNSFPSGNKHLGGTCSFDVERLLHI
ncbi:protein of unknown function (plasmid) [Azospirillum lipoferum 4B]|uniref:Uncharacterized protein n=1 Tax=Azospirillum lipoferum (strain 4B) TaxID=862719 RepID=G7ZFD3_AZOL4|nr:protein of unknown function [Azospirillum lipoferum 4B]